MNEYIGTIEAARLAGVCSRTVGMWLDKGLVKGHRLPPPGRFRRILKSDLARLMAENNMPLPPELRHYVEERLVTVRWLDDNGMPMDGN